MQIQRPWAVRRRIEYGSAYAVILTSFFSFIYLSYIYLPPNCTDGRQNGSELGIDCGGECTRICSVSVSAPVVLWAKSFLVTESQYNLVAYIENRNLVAGSPEVRYTFRVFDQQGLITERQGVTQLPANATFPVFAGRVNTMGRIPLETELVLEPADLWLPSNYDRGQIRTVATELLGVGDRPRLNVTVENTTVNTVQNVNIVAVIFDALGNPLTVSETFRDSIPGRTQADLVFTWPRPIATTLRSCDVPSDIMVVLDRSGSMAADGGTPPEPLESAKRAAADFTSLTQANDQIGFMSYATRPSTPIEQTLSSEKMQVKNAIMNTQMGTDGIQYTDMGAALAAAGAELQSVRARNDARKVIIFLTDGDVTRPLNPETGERDVVFAVDYARTEAARVKDAGVSIYTIGFGDFFAEVSGVTRDVSLIRDVASSPNQSYVAPTISELQAVYREIAEDICEVGPARIDIIPRLDGNFAPYP